MSVLKITDGKGFQITFDNGYKVSVQFGWGNYCDHYDDIPRGGDYQKKNQQLGEFGSTTAETAIIAPDGEFVEYDGGEVQGYQTANKVLAAMNYAASLPPKHPAHKEKK